MSLCRPTSLCLLFSALRQRWLNERCAGPYSALMCEQEWTAVTVAQEQTLSFAYGRGRKAGIHLQAQSECIHKDLQLLCEL